MTTKTTATTKTPRTAGAAVGSGAVDLVLSFDTTSSMHAVLAAARRQLASILHCLFSASADLRVGLIVHGDYGDLYETRLAQPTDSAAKLARFLSEAPNTCGLDYPECYELVLHQAATRIKWRQQPGVTRLLVLLGDAVPHEPNSRRNKYRLDWRKEARALADLGVAVYCVDCGGVGTGFYTFANELCGICSGAAVPYRGCRELCRLLRRLLLGQGGDTAPALERQYRSYHCHSQRAGTTCIGGSCCHAGDCATDNGNTNGAQHCTSMAQASTKKTATTKTTTMLAGLVAEKIGKTAHWAGRALLYLTLLYLLYNLYIATCW